MDVAPSAPGPGTAEAPPSAAGCPVHAVGQPAAALQADNRQAHPQQAHPQQAQPDDPALCPVDAAAARAEPQHRSVWDLRARRLLRLPPDAPRQSLIGANDAFAKSMWISATRCLITYVALPLLAPVVNLTGSFGPALGIVLSLVSMVAIAFSARRFFAGDHPWRWRYSAIGGGVFILLLIQLFIDVRTLVS